MCIRDRPLGESVEIGSKVVLLDVQLFHEFADNSRQFLGNPCANFVGHNHDSRLLSPVLSVKLVGWRTRVLYERGSDSHRIVDHDVLAAEDCHVVAQLNQSTPVEMNTKFFKLSIALDKVIDPLSFECHLALLQLLLANPQFLLKTFVHELCAICLREVLETSGRTI